VPTRSPNQIRDDSTTYHEKQSAIRSAVLDLKKDPVKVAAAMYPETKAPVHMVRGAESRTVVQANRLKFAQIEADRLKPFRVIYEALDATKVEPKTVKSKDAEGNPIFVTTYDQVPDHAIRLKAAERMIILNGEDPRMERPLKVDVAMKNGRSQVSISFGDAMETIESSDDPDEAMALYAAAKDAMRRGEVKTTFLEAAFHPTEPQPDEDVPDAGTITGPIYDRLDEVR
jgi:hypothetical protein